jgi:hypothetical protein
MLNGAAPEIRINLVLALQSRPGCKIGRSGHPWRDAAILNAATKQ